MANPWDSGPKRSSNIPGWVIWLVLLAGVAALVGFLMWRFPDALHSDGDWSRLVYLVLLLAFISSSLAVRRRLQFGKLAKMAALWVVIVAVLAASMIERNTC